MKILITHEIYPPDKIGGGEILIHRLAKELVRKGHSVKVLTTGNPRIKQYDGIKTIHLRANRYLMNLLFPLIAYYARDVDVIQTTSGNACFPSWLASKLVNKPVCCLVNHVFGKYWKDVKGNFLGTVFQLFEKMFLARSYDKIVFQNFSSKKLGMDMGINSRRMSLIQPGIDFQKFQMKNVKKEPLVLFVGNFSMSKSMCEIKGLKYLIEAAKELPEIRFVIVGEGDYLNILKKNAPSNVIFTGDLIGNSLIKLYNKASVFCLSSLAEGFGLTILEAMASGCTIVSTIDIGQEGIKIKPKDSKDIKKAIKYLISHQNTAEKMGEKNKKLAKKYTWSNYINQFIKVYQTISK